MNRAEAQAEADRRDAAETARRGKIDQKRATIRSEYGAVTSAPGPKELKAEAAPTGPLPQYDLMRQRAQRQVQSQGAVAQQSQQDAMSRRLAASGSLNSGGGVKALHNARAEVDQKTQEALVNANEGIDAQEAQQRTTMDEAVKGRNFQRETFNEEARFKEKMFRADTFAKFQGLESQLDSLDIAQLQLNLQYDESEFNKKLARHQADNSGGFFGAGGFLGLGLGKWNNDSGL
jgi:hypothetical protein